VSTPSYYRSLKNSLSDCLSKKEEMEKALTLRDDTIKELKEQNLRFSADLDNFQKKIQEESQRMMKYSSERIIKELLPVLDSLENAQDAGSSAVRKQLMDILQKEGLREIDDTGKAFDPSRHEAIGAEDGGEVNTIKKVVRKGYALEDRVIRPEMVILNKGD
jgi:molecular chaperone GrpE